MRRHRKQLSLVVLSVLVAMPAFSTTESAGSWNRRRPRVESVMRNVLVDGVAHYRLRLIVGPGAHDRIDLHRVVRERDPYRPEPTESAMFLLHGGGVGFAEFTGRLGDPDIPPSESLAVYFAERGIDVWGVDFRWVLVPEDVTDRAFMEEWDLKLHIRDVRRALAVAGFIRMRGGASQERFPIIGYSRGGSIGLAYLGWETRLAPRARLANGFVSFESLLLGTDNEDQRLAECAGADAKRDAIANGMFAADNRILHSIGRLALEAPGDASPFGAGLTNREFALAIAGAPGPLTGFHLLGADFDPNGIPIGFRYTNERKFFAGLGDFASFDALAVLRDVQDTICGERNVPFARNLERIDVPALFIGAGGGFGGQSLESFSRIGSDDTEMRVVRLTPPEDKAVDLGHLDVLFARDADDLFWQPILDWLARH